MVTCEKLCELIALPEAVADELKSYGAKESVLDPCVKQMLFARETWDEGVKQLQKAVGDDPNGLRILREMLLLACEAYERYEKMGIPLEIFIDTMKFCTRFIEADRRTFGAYQFRWAWWFPRQLSLKEFRVGCLEYEFVEGETNVVSVHIPSDADLRPEAVSQSIKAFFAFRKKYFAEWEEAKLYCESWLLSPALKELLPPSSNILRFQELFIVEHTDYESMAVMDWVFPNEKEVSTRLPENTSLQKNMKKFLLQGGKVGWTRGYLSGELFSGSVD